MAAPVYVETGEWPHVIYPALLPVNQSTYKSLSYSVPLVGTVPERQQGIMDKE